MQFLVLCPLRIQAWREVNELPGRTLDARRNMDYLSWRSLLLCRFECGALTHAYALSGIFIRDL